MTTPRPRSTSSTAAASPSRSWPASSTGPDRASIGSSTRCVPTGSSTSSSNTCRTRRSTTSTPATSILGPMPAGRRQVAPQDQGPQGAAALSFEPLRGAPARPRAGSPPVPEDELPEIPGGPRSADALDPARAKTAELDEIERLQEEALAVKNQIIRANLRLVVSIAKRHVGPEQQLLRAGLRRQHEPDPRRREVRLRPRQQVQHVCLVGDHEELRPHDPRGKLPPRPVRHRPRGDVRGRRRQPDRRARIRVAPSSGCRRP